MGNTCGDYASANFEDEEDGCLIQRVGNDFTSMTKDTTWIAGRWLGGNWTESLCFAVVDTPGIGDTSGPGKDCENFKGVAEMTRAISPIDAFVLVIKGDETRVKPALVEQLTFFQELFGDKFWDNTIIAVSFWGHTSLEAKQRKNNRGGLHEKMFENKFLRSLKNHFNNLPHIPTVFVDPVYDATDPDLADARARKWFAQETKKLWELITDGDKYECADSCSSPSFLQGTPKLEERQRVAQRIGGQVSVKWTIWFGDCKNNGVRSFTIHKDNKIIYELVENPYVYGQKNWTSGQIRVTAEKPPSLEIVDTCSNLEPGTLKCDNDKTKYKTITLTFDPLTASSLGKYKIHNINGSSEELDLVAKVDGFAGPWGPWGACSKTCLGKDLAFGTRERSRNASEPLNGGKPFNGSMNGLENCGSNSDEWR